MALLKRSTSAWEQHTTTMQRELTALRSQLMQVDKGQTALAQALDQLRKHVLAARPEPPSVSEQDTTAVSHSPEEEIAHADAELQAQIETLEAVLYEEKPDPAWTKNAEQALHAMWQGQENFGLFLVHAECRTSLCRLELELDGTRSSEESFHTLIHHMPWSGQRFVQITEGEAPQVVMYLAREGYELPLDYSILLTMETQQGNENHDSLLVKKASAWHTSSQKSTSETPPILIIAYGCNSHIDAVLSPR
jgi:hypothetical protein